MFFYRDLGLMKRTKVSLPAESSGIFREPNVGDKISPLTMSFGQGFAVTPIQLAYGLAALVNGGKTVEPQIVRQIRTRYFGEFGRNEKKSEVQYILNESNSRRLRHMLSEVVSEEGSGKLAALDHVLKAMGKTGTSQRFNRERKSYVGGGYWSSFWGAFPKENPQIGVLVIFETDSKGEYYGGKVAAPAFKEIAEAALRFIGLELNLSPALKSLSLVE